MKTITLLCLALMAMMTAHADEGMWTLYNLPDAVYGQMQREGFRLPKSMLYDDVKALKNSVVNFCDYCTGEVVSPLGLVLTNHHCGFESIRSHSTVEKDYMLNGFYAKEQKEELPNKDMFVAFMRSQRDITMLLDSLGYSRKSLYGKDSLLDSLANALTKEAQAQDSTLYVEIDPFYEGNIFYATTYQRYTDIRLVYAPPKSLGKFGGETDNWMWPRQTCDISVFRIYVDSVTGGPADYKESNVPMQPKAWLPVSTAGYKNESFAMVMGYPGSTERYLSSYGIQEMRDCDNDPRQQVRGIKQEVMKRHMDRDEAVRIKYDSKYAQSANYWKNAIGMNKCIDSIGIIQMKKDYEKRIALWYDSIAASPRGTIDSLSWSRISGLSFPEMAELYGKRKEAMRAANFFYETFSRRSNNELCTRASKYNNGLPVKGPEGKVKKQYLMFEDNSKDWDRDLDIEALAVMLKNYREHVPAKYRPDFYETIDRKFNGDYNKYVTYVWDNSILMQKEAHLPVHMTSKLKRDPGIKFAMALLETQADIKEVLDACYDSIDAQERRLCAAKVRMEQELPHYSDANFTMRLTYGQVGGYSLGGYDSGYYTTAQSLVDKMDSKLEDYYAEPVFKELMGKDADFGVFRDSVTKTLNLCFLTNNDITGGNSGSPCVDSEGRLIGLAFDGNWDSLSADIFFDEKLARSINVDIRYILYIMKAWAHADRLLEEMNIPQ